MQSAVAGAFWLVRLAVWRMRSDTYDRGEVQRVRGVTLCWSLVGTFIRIVICVLEHHWNIHRTPLRVQLGASPCARGQQPRVLQRVVLPFPRRTGGVV